MERTELFKRSYKRLSSQMQSRTEEAITHLARSEDPKSAGTRKRGRLSRYLAYEIGRSYRLIYRVIDHERIILLVVVGDHKSVYGKD